MVLDKGYSLKNNVILLVFFGTSHVRALTGIINVKNTVAAAYPKTSVCIAFTSKIICNLWQQRSVDEVYRAGNPGVPDYIYDIKHSSDVIFELLIAGCRSIIVQPVFMHAGREYRDLVCCLESFYVSEFGGLSNGKEVQIVAGRPLLSTLSSIGSEENGLYRAATALVEDVKEAAGTDTALIYCGHGNKDGKNEVYVAFQQTLRMVLKYKNIYVATLSGNPSISDVIVDLKDKEISTIQLRPLMIVAGIHVVKELAGDDATSWQKQLEQEDYRVKPVFKGLGENSSVAGIFVERIAALATRKGITLE